MLKLNKFDSVLFIIIMVKIIIIMIIIKIIMIRIIIIIKIIVIVRICNCFSHQILYTYVWRQHIACKRARDHRSRACTNGTYRCCKRDKILPRTAGSDAKKK